MEGGRCQLCEICLIKSLSLQDLCAFAGACINARARGVCSRARAFSAILWNAASPDAFQSTVGFQTRKAFDLPPSPSPSPHPEENPLYFSLPPPSLSASLSLFFLSFSLHLSLSWDERTRGNVGPTPHSDQI